MSEFRQLIITNKGQSLMAKLIAGKANVTFTKVAASATTYNDSQIPALTALSNIKQQVAVSKVTRINSVGNLWKWVDGINTNNGSTFAAGDTGTIYVADHGFKDNSGDAPYHEVGFSSV